jgi:hypothetical protein
MKNIIAAAILLVVAIPHALLSGEERVIRLERADLSDPNLVRIELVLLGDGNVLVRWIRAEEPAPAPAPAPAPVIKKGAAWKRIVK